MDHSYSENELSLSPSQILERLQVLRQLQIMQRGKLQKQRSQYEGTPETSSTITEVVSHFSNSTSYNTFRSLLMSPQDTATEPSPRVETSSTSQKVLERDLIDGVTVLNLSQESEFISNSPVSTRSKASLPPKTDTDRSSFGNKPNANSVATKHISLDEMPILSPKQDFESPLMEKLKNDEHKTKSPIKDIKNDFPTQTKKPFLRKGEGMSRFGLRKNYIVIQNTKSLPWRRNIEGKNTESPTENSSTQSKAKKKVDMQVVINEPKHSVPGKNIQINNQNSKKIQKHLTPDTAETIQNVKRLQQKTLSNIDEKETSIETNDCELHNRNNSWKPIPHTQRPALKHPLLANKGQTWAAVLTKEQDDFLRQLKQSDYYKNFVSPAKSTVSDMSCDENLCRLRQEREIAEQNMFELIENKVTNESFNLESSFFTKFLKSSIECSGESTPLIMKKCLITNPELMRIFPDFAKKNRNDSQSTANTSEYTDCCDTCSSVSTCSSCKTVEEVNTSPKKKVSKQKDEINARKKEVEKENVACHNDTVTESDALKSDMAEMNAKLVATSELLKDRLRELEDEIETFRKENASIAKMREEIDTERQKFYEEKSAFEQKFNEEKILSEYYLAEEKEKISKQKQIYDRHVREMRGRLSKKDKDEVVNLKKEISDLKEEIRIKDAKSTSTIARLRNQLKIMEKEKATLQENVEKLKKENRRIQHSNEISRRLTNIKYLEQINKKLNNMAKEPQSATELDSDVKYKAYEIERQSRSRKVQPMTKGPRPRAKSVPNLNVTSRYAKYFSQRDTVSQMDQDPLLNIDLSRNNHSFHDIDYNDNEIVHSDETQSVSTRSNSPPNEANILEKIYLERFRSTSPKSNRSSLSSNNSKNSIKENPDSFFIRKSNSNLRDSKSPNDTATSPFLTNNESANRPKSPSSSNRPGLRSSQESRDIQRPKSPSILSRHNRSTPQESRDILNAMGDHNRTKMQSNLRTKSPMSILSNRPGQRAVTALKDTADYREKLLNLSPEPTTSKTSFSKTSLNPTEIQKSDGSRELRYPNGNVKYISADKKYSKFVYYNGDVKENFYNEGRVKYFYAEAKTYHTTHADGLEVLEFPDGQVEKRYKDGSSEIRLPNGSIRYFDPKNVHIREEWRFPDGTTMTVSANDEKRIVFGNGQVEVHNEDHKRREYPDGTVKLVYNDGTSETRYASGRVRVKDKHGNLIMDSANG